MGRLNNDSIATTTRNGDTCGRWLETNAVVRTDAAAKQGQRPCPDSLGGTQRAAMDVFLGRPLRHWPSRRALNLESAATDDVTEGLDGCGEVAVLN